MDRAQAQNGMDQDQNQRAVEQARRQLDRALEQLTAQRQADAEEIFSDLSERAELLLNEQRRLAAELQQVAREALENRDNDGVRENPLSDEETIELAERKWLMQADLEELEEEMQRVSQRYRDQTPDASAQLSDALSDLQRTQAVRRLAYAGEMIRRGLADELSPFEGIVTTALDDLRRDTEQALATASREARDGQQAEQNPTSELVAELQELRRDLADLQNPITGQQGQQASTQDQPAAGGQSGSNQLSGGGGSINENGKGTRFLGFNLPH
jgi:Exonuclease VII, large subunit